MSSSEADESLDELSDDNKNYFNDLMFTNKCVSLLSEMKSFIELLFEKYENTFDSIDTHFYEILVKEAEDVLPRDMTPDCMTIVKTEVNDDDSDQTNFELLSKSTIDSSLSTNSVNETSSVASEAFDYTPEVQPTSLQFVERIRSNLSHKLSNNKQKQKKKKEKPLLRRTSHDPVIYFGGQSSDGEMLDLDLKGVTCGWPGCDFKTSKRGPLILHRMSHRKHKFTCYWPNCGKGFAQRIHMETHYNAVHKKIKPFICSENGCTFRTAYKWELTLHSKNRHSADGTKKYKCEISGCDYTTNYKTSIEVHTRTHNNDKPFVCHHPGCESRFTARQNLRNHIATHATELNFGCAECGQRFKNKKNLGHHLRAVHKIRRR